MICPKCGKKVEYILPTCKYCDEPIVLEGVLPLGDIADKTPVSTAAPAYESSFVGTETYPRTTATAASATGASKPEMWKYIVAACICAFIVLGSVIMIINITDSDKGAKNISESRSRGDTDSAETGTDEKNGTTSYHYDSLVDSIMKEHMITDKSPLSTDKAYNDMVKSITEDIVEEPKN